jgi:hypothetical protein
MILAGATQGAWVYIPQEMRESLPQGLVTGLTIGLLILGIVGRLVDQRRR